MIPEKSGKGGAGLLLATTVSFVILAGGLAAFLQWTEPAVPPTAQPRRETAIPLPKPIIPAGANAQITPPEAPAAPASVTAQAPAPLPKSVPSDRRKADALVPAPDPALVEKGPVGPLPKIAKDGRKPWQVYARPFDHSDKRPRIAILVTGVGLSEAATQAAINDLPGSISLAFDPYSPHLDDSIERARAAGHEVFLALPLEPADYPRDDPGPYTLLTSLDAKQNLDRLQWVLSRVTGYVGVVTAWGARFTTSKADLLPVLDAVNGRGLMVVDSRSTERSVTVDLARNIGLPRAAGDLTLDQDASRDAIDGQLQRLETIAKRDGVALGLAYVYPVTIERLAKWSLGLEARGDALAPVTGVADLQPQTASDAAP